MIINILFFENFEPLDAFGPIEVFSRYPEAELRYISLQGGIVTSNHGIEINTVKAAPEDLQGVLLVPGGMGTRTLVNDPQFIADLKTMAEASDYCLTVCTGSALLAKTGLIDGLKATGNKRAFGWTRSVNENVRWIEHARWQTDGKYYTSSGVSAGMDMALAFMADRFGKDRAEEAADQIEYIWNKDPQNDPFVKS